ncbi:Long chain fatty acid CoA ligase [Nucleospora cyclopteri]
MNKTYFVQTGIIKNSNFEEHEKALKHDNRTLLDIFLARVERNPDSPFLGTISNQKVSYKNNSEILAKIEIIARFLESITEKDDFIGLFSINRPEWFISEYAGYRIGCSNIPIYATFHSTNLIHIIKQTNLKILFGTSDKIIGLLAAMEKAGSENSIKHVILFDDFDNTNIFDQYPKVKFYKFTNILEMQNNQQITRLPHKQEDVATICYTSGTAGNPKGVVLTHKNFVSHIVALSISKNETDYIKIQENDTYISYLPLSHVFERMMFTFVVAYSGRIAFYSGDPKLLATDFNIIKPSLVSAVPKVLSVFEAKIKESVKSKNIFARLIFLLAVWFKLFFVKKGINKVRVLDKFLFNKVKQRFGGNIRFVLCGGAAVNPETLEFLKVNLCCHIIQGYAQTESLAACCLQKLNDTDANSIGIPFPDTQCKIVPVKDFPNDQGELYIQGPGVTNSYYKEENINRESFEDNWFKTGDVIKLKNNQLYVVGRVKDFIKTSYGEYIAVEHLETLFISEIIDDIFITSSKYSEFLIAFVVCTDKTIKSTELLKIIKEKGRKLVNENKINKYEIPQHVFLVETPFINLNNGLLLTPSLKKKRKQFNEYFKDEIENLNKCLK